MDSTTYHNKAGLVALLLATLVCAGLAAQEGHFFPEQSELPPAGFGTLGQNDIGIQLRTPDFVINAIPLDEGIIRLLAPDTYRSMQRLLESKSGDIANTARRYGVSTPTVFLVSFFGTAAGSAGRLPQNGFPRF